MARSETRTGFDVNGIERVGLILREVGGLRSLDKVWQEGTVGIHQIGGSWLTPLNYPAELRALTTTTTIGVLEQVDGVSHQKSDQTDAHEAFQQSNKWDSPINNVSSDTSLTVPLYRLVDGKYALIEVKVAAANVAYAAAWGQRFAPRRLPLLDTPVVALLRAFTTLRADQRDDRLLLLAHVDLWRTYVLLYQGGTLRQLITHREGLANLAGRVAGDRNARFDETLRDLMAGKGWDEKTHERLRTLIQTPTLKATRMHEANDQSERRSSELFGVPRPSASQLETVVLSGPLADIDGIDEVVRTSVRTPSVERWRPVAEMKGATAEARAHAGRYTIALGHALNERGTLRMARLPLDFTMRLRLEHLPEDARDPITIVATQARKGRKARVVAGPAVITPAQRHQIQRIRLGLYGGVVLILGMSAVYPSLRLQLVRRENLRLESDTLTLASAVLNLRNLQAETDLMAAKRAALAALQAGRADGGRVLDITARTMNGSAADVWLTELHVTSRLDVNFLGTGRSPASIASFLNALRADSAVRGVALQRMTRDSKTPTWNFTARIALKSPDAPPATPLEMTRPIAATSTPSPLPPTTPTNGAKK